MNAEYKIRTLEDFNQIPDELLGDCLTDFSAYIQFSKKAVELGFQGESSFIWINDGIRGISEVRITGREVKPDDPAN